MTRPGSWNQILSVSDLKLTLTLSDFIASVPGHFLMCSVHTADDTYVKTSVPQPAVSVKSRGPRSRAGFIAPPQLADIDMEIPRTITATIGGISPGGAGVFLVSPKHRMHNINMPVPTT